MKYFNDINVISIAFFSMMILSCSGGLVINNRPIIGILTEEVMPNSALNASSIMIASYVKFLETGGARVVPIMINKPVKYYEDLMSKINGVLFPGGAALFKSMGYGRTGKIVFDTAIKMNSQGDYFPLWGTCLGFEMLNYLAVDKDWMKACHALDMPANINFSKGFEDSKVFKDLDDSLKNIMLNQKIAIHYHRWCITPHNYSVSHLNKFFKVVATNKDLDGVEFVSMIEAHKYPFYGVTFHPEKVLFEWVLSKGHQNIPHSGEAVEVSQYFSHFFVNEARKSSHKFPSKKEEDEVLIFNYNPVFTGKDNSYAEQIYYFN